MRLRDLRIEASPAASDLGRVAPNIVFRWTTHHIQKLVVGCLPKAYVLDGSSVFQITCGPRGSEPQYSSRLGSSEYFADEFDFAAYCAAPPRERDEVLLQLIETVLSDVARRVGRDAAVIKTAVQAVRALEFRQALEIKKLGRRLPNGGRITVVRTLSREEGEAWRVRVMASSGGIVTESVMGSLPNYLDRRDYYAAAELSEGDYVVRTNRGKESFRYQLGGLFGAKAG